jgi:hypothetical protein
LADRRGVFRFADPFFASCAGGDDDDDDGGIWGDDDRHHGDDDSDDDSDDDDDATPPAACQDYADSFFGPDGCFPDADVYDSTLAFCAELAAENNGYADSFYACLSAIDCAQIDDLLDLWDAIQQCLDALLGG